MASKLSLISLLILSVIFHVSGNSILFEDGYTVKTIINGHKLNINPNSILPLIGSSDFVVLDSANSVFYSVSSPLSQGSVVKKLTGNGYGYFDGDLDRAKFDKPRSFVVDYNGNVYVADRMNQVIRKISKSGGVRTIAQTYTLSHEGEPDKNVTFSKDFELTFVPEICALLVIDHMSWFIHQIDLKPADCVRASPPRSVFGPVLVWILGLGVASLIGFASGFVIRPYMTSRTGTLHYQSLDTAALEPQFQNLEAFPNQSGQTNTDVLLRHQKQSRSNPGKDFVSLLDSDVLGSCEIKKVHVYADPLAELINLDVVPKESNLTSEIFKQGDGRMNLSDSHGRLDSMIKANMVEFAEAPIKPRNVMRKRN
ncbi:hypothetical protein ACFE04_024879 [Oxalis oulophora]